MAEHDEQVALFDWLGLRANQAGMGALRFAFAIPNGGWRAKTTGKWLKAEGLKPGVPDTFLPIPRGGYFGLWIEMKWGGNKPTLEQIAYLNFLDSVGFCTRVCYDAEEAMAEIEWYMKLPPTTVKCLEIA